MLPDPSHHPSKRCTGVAKTRTIIETGWKGVRCDERHLAASSRGRLAVVDVITHVEQIKEAFPVRIEVTKTSAGSTFVAV